MTAVKRVTAYKLATAASVLATLLDCEDLAERELIQTAYNLLVEYRQSMSSDRPPIPSDDRHYRPYHLGV